MGFTSIQGQERAIGILQKAIRTDRVHHAYLFAGPDGVGKGKVALAFAQTLLCVDHAESPCGHCTHCTRIAENQHPDVLRLEPDRSKARHVIKIEHVRNLTRQVNFRPYEGRRRVIIIDDAETMTEEDSNALLKTLEEPTGETLFVLLTSQARLLLATIRSRCQTLRFAPLDTALVRQILLTEGVPEDTAKVAAAFSEGSVGQAMALTQEGALETRRAILERLGSLDRSSALPVFSFAQDLASKNVDSRAALDALRSYYRDISFLISGASPERVVNVDVRPLVEKGAQELTLEVALGHIERINHAQRDLRAYVDARLVIENLLFSLLGKTRPARR